MNKLTSKKKVKRFCSFNDNWLNDENFKLWLMKYNEEYAKCKICQVNFTIKYDGISAVKQHLNSLKHKNMDKQQKQNQLLHNFLESKDTSETESLSLCELSFTYHSVKHHHSYNSADCFTKNAKTLFPDSKLAQKLRCGRTKMEAIVKNVLAKASLQDVLYDLKNSSVSQIVSTNEPTSAASSTDRPVIFIPYLILLHAMLVIMVIKKCFLVLLDILHLRNLFKIKLLNFTKMLTKQQLQFLKKLQKF